METNATDSTFARELAHEHVELFHDPATALRGVIAVHSTALGPSMGGVRLSAYASTVDAALDALRLARAMTWKNAAAGLDLGGGKSVLVDDGRWSEAGLRERRMRAFGAIVERLGGRYVAAEDVGTTPEDMDAIGAQTRWVAGRPIASGGRGDPSAATARTVFAAIAEAAELQLGRRGLAGVRVGVLGVGNVGGRLARLLASAGATLVLTDVAEARLRALADELGAAAVPLDGFVTSELDVLAPCALGGVIAPGDVARLRCRAIAGAANNQLADPASATALHEAGILYVPDFLANCGGIVHVGAELLGFDDVEVDVRIERATAGTAELLRTARDERRVPLELAVARVQQRVAATAVAR